jgi:hypothetical protein
VQGCYRFRFFCGRPIDTSIVLLPYTSGGTGLENFLSHPTTATINDRYEILPFPHCRMWMGEWRYSSSSTLDQREPMAVFSFPGKMPQVSIDGWTLEQKNFLFLQEIQT